MRKKASFWLPLAIFVVFCVAALVQIARSPVHVVESRMIGKELPGFDLRPAHPDRPGLTVADLKTGTPHLLNIWASWCVPCAAEAAQLQALNEQGAKIVGVAIRDKPEDVAEFLARYGNPYQRIGADDLSEVQLGIGSSGVPETFVVDGQGVIRYQYIGDIRSQDVPFLLKKLQEAAE